MAQNHNKTINHQLSRTSIIIVGLLILIQGILYLAASAWSFLIFKCRLIPSTHIGKVMHFIYFRDCACGEIIWSKSSTSDSVIPNMPNVTLVAFRTYFLVCAYGIINLTWIFTTLMVLSSLCCSSTGRKTFHCVFIPWMIVVTVGSILDVLATGFHIHDIYNTVTVENVLNYLDVVNIDKVLPEMKDFSKLFIYPAIILTCVSSRLIIIWLINIFGVFSASRQAKKFMCHKTNTRNSAYEQQVFPSQKDVAYDQKEFPSKESSMTMYNTSSVVDNSSRKDRKTFEPFKPTLKSGLAYDNKYSYHHQDEELSESRHRSRPDNKSITKENLHRYDDMSPIAYRKFQQHYPDPDDDDYRRLSLGSSSERRRELPPNPPREYRFSLQNPSKDYQRNEKKNQHHHHHGIENVHITDELRGQLPWSYFNARDDLTTAKRALSHTEEHDDDEDDGENHEVMPPVPVPDYTYHFPRKERPSIKSGDNEFNNHIISPPSIKLNHNNQSSNNRW